MAAMAASVAKDYGGVVTKERFAQLVRARLPVNPLDAQEFTGANLTRLKTAMESTPWHDPRFVSEAEAQRAGWAIKPDAASVQTKLRDGRNVALFNAADVIGMPALEAMLGMDDAALARQQGRVVADLGGEVRIEPAGRGRAPAAARVAPPAATRQVASVPANSPAAPAASGRYAVMAPYWLDHMHNHTGLTLAAELNEIIRDAGLSMHRDSIQRLLEGRDKAWMYELAVVPEEELERDPWRFANPACPAALVGGELVRDKEGAYRPKAGGRALLVDNGESLTVKSKSELAYRGAIELALAKGWTAIELSGKGPMLADAWLEATLQGLEVVNYSPSVEDEKRLVARMAERAELVAQAPAAPIEQSPEIVEVRPYLDAGGREKMGVITYTVTQQGEPDISFTDPRAAAKCFAQIDAAKAPAVIRAVVRLGSEVNTGVMVAGTGPGTTAGSLEKTADAAVSEEFATALADVLETEKLQAEQALAEAPAAQLYSGMIQRIEGNEVVQKIGRDPSQVKRFDIAKLNRVPRVGDVVEIAVGADGNGVVSEREPALGIDR